MFLPNNHLMARIRALLYEAFILDLDIIIVWIPAHIGIKGNETADYLAKLAIRDGILISSNLPVLDIVAATSSKARDRAKNFLTMQFAKKGISYFKYKLFTLTNNWFHNLEADRISVTSICRIRFGHCNTSTILYRFGLKTSPLCRCGEGNEDVNHIFLKCPLYSSARSTLMNKLKDLKDLNIHSPLINIYQVLSIPTLSIANVLQHFLRTTELHL